MPPRQKSSAKCTRTWDASTAVYKRWLDSIPTVSRKDAPEKWTIEWERFLQSPRPRGLEQFYLKERVIPGNDDFLLSCYRGSYRDVCRIQHEVSVTACNVASHTDFEATWLGWTAAKRRDFLQEAIVRGVGCSEQYEGARPYCREVSIAFLESSLLDVLKHCLLDDLSEVPKTPIIYPIEFLKEIDETVLPPMQGLMLRYTRLCHTQVISSVLGQALTLFIGADAIESKPLRGNYKLKGGFVDKKARKEMPSACEHCQKVETDPKKQKMQICARCKSIGRTMPYCSQQCVKDDWPRHKIICGKPFTEENVVATAVVNPATGHGRTPGIVPPFAPLMRASRQCSVRPCTGGYKRSPALLRQVLLLQQNPSVDYFLCLPSTGDNLISILLPDDTMSARFCAARDEAMSSGDLGTLRHVIGVLLQAAFHLIVEERYRPEYLVAQIRKEYDVDITKSIG
ncbi:hypothetical protein C8R47DRAFT_1315725 [Mycena vitilis]|nr:hypothetical protein C8R47DRAFT_1315725 [Mycena vitilis]